VLCTFLASPRKVPKEGDQGAHRHYLWRTLTSILFGQKMFRFFARRVGFRKFGKADVVEQSALAIMQTVVSFTR